MISAIRQQFGAAIDALDGAIQSCPDEAWAAGTTYSQPSYLAFHAMFWLDLYLSESGKDYAPPAPYTLGELRRGVYPERAYEKTELMAWLETCRQNLAARLATFDTPEDFGRTCHLHWGEMKAGELLLYNLRHVQHHAAQINLLVRQHGESPGAWTMRADGLGD
jgi:hypothetical protein